LHRLGPSAALVLAPTERGGARQITEESQEIQGGWSNLLDHLGGESALECHRFVNEVILSLATVPRAERGEEIERDGQGGAMMNYLDSFPDCEYCSSFLLEMEGDREERKDSTTQTRGLPIPTRTQRTERRKRMLLLSLLCIGMCQRHSWLSGGSQGKIQSLR
jgi:hypothetical protein